MATLRKGRCYSNVTRAYTRKSKFKKKGYVKAAPSPKIVRYNMGDTKKEFPRQFVLRAKEPVQVRHNAMESCRTLINRVLQKRLGKDFLFKVVAYPHHILRENKMLTGAGADRMQSGMSHSFGKSMGLAAQLKRDDVLFLIAVNGKDTQLAIEVLKMARPRIPGKFAVEEVA